MLGRVLRGKKHKSAILLKIEDSCRKRHVRQCTLIEKAWSHELWKLG